MKGADLFELCFNSFVGISMDRHVPIVNLPDKFYS
jgi:hypothetical protein